MFCIEFEWQHPTHRKMYGTFLFFMQCIVPLIVIAWAYGAIGRHFNAGSEFHKRITSEWLITSQRQRSFDRCKRTNGIFAAMIITFAVASAPQRSLIY
jgi:hypothetical protein